MHAICGVLSAVVVIAASVPYLLDVLAKRVRPARSTRLMLFVLMVVTLAQQDAVGGGWSLALTGGEALCSLLLLGLAVGRGSGGLGPLDVACYLLLIADLILWLASGSALLALHLSVAADIVAFTPTLAKTWRTPSSETVPFYAGSAAAAVLAMFAEETACYRTLLFPAYLAIANVCEVALIKRRPCAGKSTAPRVSRPQLLCRAHRKRSVRASASIR